MRRTILLVALLGCGEAAGPSGNGDPFTFTKGTYLYTLTDPRPGGAGTYAGSILVATLTADSIAGTWSVPGFHATVELGGGSNGVYRPWAALVTGGVVQNTWTVTATGIQCAATISTGTAQAPVHTPSSCTVTRP